MKTHNLISMLLVAMIGLFLTSCAPTVGVRADYGYGPSYGYGYSPYRYGYRRPVVVTPPPRVVYRSYPKRHYYRNQYRAPQQYSYRSHRGRGPR
ncbi:hypothetical protein [Larkinella rosea]|uniref:Neuropeptide-like protein 29 n=1 Tax=Larkinella rosea TaxID=2025312 RepID=A0A3P1BBS5_9BACT|nr:hypothetical protein [Larkinella rosea]RRA98546.1 hypothetical protein EHT25_26435 [Larkinella rosea]